MFLNVIAQFIVSFVIFAQNTVTSELPLIKIETGTSIPDEPKISGKMFVYNLGHNDNTIDFACNIGIEIRGNSSQGFPKKQYAVETQTENGENLNISLLGLPKENDWILSAPYDDKTLLRNNLCYDLMNSMGCYAPRTRFCELIINNDYKGIYVLTEKIKRDENRVQIPKDGFLIETSGKGRIKDDEIFFIANYSKSCQIIKYPKNPEINDINKIKQLFDNFENIIIQARFSQNSIEKLNDVFDIDASIDYILLSESIRSLDAFFVSTFWHTDKTGKLVLGPLWDCNITLGNANYHNCWQTEGTYVFNKWWAKLLMRNSNYKTNLCNRWKFLRKNCLSDSSVLAKIDSLAGIIEPALYRNFERWDILDKYVWPNYFVGHSYSEELYYMKSWMLNRLHWMDCYLGTCPYYAQVSKHDGKNNITIKGDSIKCKLYRKQADTEFELFHEAVCKDSLYYSDREIADNTVYYYKVTSEGHEQLLPCLSEPNIPLAPQNLSYQYINDTTIQLQWEDNAWNEAHFHVEKRVDDEFVEVKKLFADSCTFILESSAIAGEYRVYASNRIGNSSTSNSIVVPNEQYLVKAYPTIVNKEFIVKLYGLKGQDLYLNLIDAMGKEYNAFKPVAINNMNYELHIPMSQIKTGVYIIVIYTPVFQKNFFICKE